MKGLILLGGIPYSGKTTFGKRLGESTGWGVQSVDTIMEAFYKNPDLMEQVVKLYSKGSPTPDDKRILRQARRHGRVIKEDAYKWYLEEGMRNPGTRAWADIHVYTFFLASISMGGGPEIFEAMLHNPDSRTITYNLLSMMLEDVKGIHLDEVPKKLVYFDKGLELSLLRQTILPAREGREFLKSSETFIRKAYAEQQPPAEGELPNTEVLMISDAQEETLALEMLLR